VVAYIDGNLDFVLGNGAPPMDLSPLAPGREGGLSEDALKAACRLQYAHHYWDHVPTA
jgi:hypothetical protein